MNLYPGRQPVLLQLFHLTVHCHTDLHDVGITGSGNQDAHSPLSIAEHLVADRRFVPLLDAGDIAQAQLVVVMSLNQQVANVVHCFELVRHVDAYPVLAVVVISAIDRLVLSVQRGQHLGRFHAQIGHTVLQQRDIDAIRTFAIQVDALHSFQVVHLPFDQFGIVSQFTVVHAVTCQGIEHAEHIAKVVLHHRAAGPFGQHGVSHLSSQQVPALLHLLVLRRGGQLHLNQ